jgi:hypothetical protein
MAKTINQALADAAAVSARNARRQGACTAEQLAKIEAEAKAAR